MNKQFINKVLKTNAGLGSLIIRIPVGLILVAHGSQKLFAWFGGYGLEGTGQWMESIGLAPGFLMALLAGSAEFFGGIALILGLLTRPAALLIAFTMLVAIFTAHISNGLFISNGGIEYALTLFAATLALTFQGAGRFSIDNRLATLLGK
ncbi:DoxX family protein [Psychromonas sp. 14N.309.X.WAT.B.A12]|jgi:putative oxidoreductase|uniref:DoxX family protein n=1 Tax=unclassified Psychromonas TaxID=2614957 RepID=UPI0025AF34BA|nr:DoxX family protein [Psychromonas sp. 14N.309.X.WAT.B.A12]MDN2661890.1 DoxX family protein [Psychromonas sp. 14N.309.X.WAT.B.A12]